MTFLDIRKKIFLILQFLKNSTKIPKNIIAAIIIFIIIINIIVIKILKPTNISGGCRYIFRPGILTYNPVMSPTQTKVGLLCSRTHDCIPVGVVVVVVVVAVVVVAFLSFGT